MKYRIIIIFFIGFSSISGCMGWGDMGWGCSYRTPTRQYQTSDLIGAYMEHWIGEGTLYLNADGTYLQQNKLKCNETEEEKIEENKGHWRLQDNIVYFSNEMVLYNWAQTERIESQYNQEIILSIIEKRWSKEFVLAIDQESVTGYVKIK